MIRAGTLPAFREGPPQQPAMTQGVPWPVAVSGAVAARGGMWPEKAPMRTCTTGPAFAVADRPGEGSLA